MVVKIRKRPQEEQPLLTLANILRIQAELEEDQRLFAELPGRIAEKQKRLDAAMLFAPEGFDPASKAARRPRFRANSSGEDARSASALSQTTLGGQITWISEIARILNTSPRGLSHKEVLAQAKQTALGKHPSPGEKGFYNAIGRLTKKGEIIKSGGLLYSKKLVKELKAKGQVLPDMSADVRRRAGGGGALVVGVLRDHAQGLTAPELKKILSALPDAPQSIRAHGQYIYNILGTLMGAGTVTREEGVYRLAQRDNGARR